MKHPEVQYLYKYMKFERALEVVKTGKIFFPTAEKFNDPFDCNIQFDPEISPEEFVGALFRRYKAVGNNWNSIKTILDEYLNEDGSISETKRDENRKIAEDFNESNAKLGILSLTEDPLSLLMWAHYGDYHRGVCIGFERVEGIILADEEVTSKVDYSDVYPLARFSEILMSDGSLSRKILRTKACDWAYEKESSYATR